jgi:hypothetical protein
MARAGKCYVRLAEPMVAYRFYSGFRRVIGIPTDPQTKQDYKERLAYIITKFEGSTTMGCSSCPKPGGTPLSITPSQAIQKAVTTMTDDAFVLCVYNHPNRGMHPCIGRGNEPKIDYGYRKAGEEFLVHQADINAQPNIFIPKAKAVQEAPAEIRFTPPPPVKEEVKILPLPGPDSSVDQIPGIDAKSAALLKSHGIVTRGDVASKSVEELVALGLSKTRAALVIKASNRDAA